MTASSSDEASIYDWPPLTLWLTGLILALVVFVIVLPACCTACYHWYSYKKGWDDDISQCESNCSGCFHESMEEAQFRRREKWRTMCRMLKADALKQAGGGGGVEGGMGGGGTAALPMETTTVGNNSNHI